MSENEPRPDQPTQPFIKALGEMENYIKTKYNKLQPNKEARKDSLYFAALQLGFYLVEPVINPHLEKEELKFVQTMQGLWKNAIDKTKDNDWSGMKTALQDYTQSVLTSAAIRESWHEENINVAPGDEDEKRAKAFLNLMKSLEVI